MTILISFFQEAKRHAFLSPKRKEDERLLFGAMCKELIKIMNITMLPPPPFSPLSPSEGSPLSSPVSAISRSSRRSLSSRISHVSAGGGDRKNRAHSPAVLSIILILASILVLIQWVNMDYGCPGCNEIVFF